MKRFFFLVAALFGMISCAPTISILEVDVKNPAERPLDIKGKQLAVFTPIYDSIMYTDSLLMNAFATSIASQLGVETAQPNQIPLFTHTCGSTALGTLDQPEYADALAQESHSQLVFLVDSVHVGAFESKGVSRVSDGFKEEMIALPFHSVLRVYDADNQKFTQYIPLRDSVMWRIWVDPKVEKMPIPRSALEDLQTASGYIASSLVQTFTDQWETQDRVIFVFTYGGWQKAYDYAEAFEWDKARAIWMELLDSKNAVKSACAAYNIALSCEIGGQIDLAKEWLNYAQKTYSMPETTYYLQILEERSNVAKQLLKPIYQ